MPAGSPPQQAATSASGKQMPLVWPVQCPQNHDFALKKLAQDPIKNTPAIDCIKKIEAATLSFVVSTLEKDLPAKQISALEA